MMGRETLFMNMPVFRQSKNFWKKEGELSDHLPKDIILELSQIIKREDEYNRAIQFLVFLSEFNLTNHLSCYILYLYRTYAFFHKILHNT